MSNAMRDYPYAEQPLFFESGRASLFGILHTPPQTSNRQGIVFCHPFMEEKLWAHRVFVSFARKLAMLGYTILRFDYFGHGDSEGDFEQSTVKTRLTDIHAAIEFLKSSCPDLEFINLLGLRFGATLAGIVASERKDIAKLMLWEPVINGSNYMQEILRSNLTTQLAIHGKVMINREQLIETMKAGNTVNIEGYEMTYELFLQGSNIQLCEYSHSYDGRVLIIQIGKAGQPLRKELQECLAGYTNGELDQVVEEPFWREIKKNYSDARDLTARTLDWLSK